MKKFYEEPFFTLMKMRAAEDIAHISIVVDEEFDEYGPNVDADDIV